MPIENKISNDEEKLILNNNQKLVDEYNKYLPEEFRLSYDSSITDTKEIKYYNTLKFIRERNQKQEEIYNDLKIRLGNIPTDRLLLEKSFKSSLKTENTADAKEYNESIYRKYQSDPEKLFYKRYKKVLEFNPNKLIEIANDKQKIADFYIKNQPLCDDAFYFKDAIKNPNSNVNRFILEKADILGNEIADLGKIKEISEKNINYISYPKLNDNQINIINDKIPDLIKEYKNLFNNEIDVKKYAELKNNGLIIGKGFYLKYMALDKDKKEIPLKDAFLNNKLKTDIEIKQRNKDDIFNLSRINDTYDREYLGIWINKFTEIYNKGPFDYDQIKEDNKGKFFERLFNTTSRQYKAFISALGEFQDPTSLNYMNKKLLKEKAKGYFDFKTEQGLSLNNSDKTAKNRLMLAAAVLKTFKEMENDAVEVEKEISSIINSNDIDRKQFLKEEDLEDDLSCDLIEDDQELENNLELEA